MTNPDELLPCPFDGAPAMIIPYDGRYRAQCTQCGTSVGEFKKRAECAPNWNRRAPATALSPAPVVDGTAHADYPDRCIFTKDELVEHLNRAVSRESLNEVDARTAFEEWMASSNYPEIAEIALEKLPDGNYKSQNTFAAWEGWKGGVRFAQSAPVVDEKMCREAMGDQYAEEGAAYTADMIRDGASLGVHQTFTVKCMKRLAAMLEAARMAKGEG